MSSTNQFNGRDAQGIRKTHLKQGIDDVFFHLTVDYHFKRLLRVMPENIKQKFRQAAYGLIHPIVNRLYDNDDITAEETAFIDEINNLPESLQELVPMYAFGSLIGYEPDYVCKAATGEGSAW